MASDRPSLSPSINWVGTSALAFGGCNLSFFLFGALFNHPGTISVLLLMIGMLLAVLAAPGWLKLILSYPDRVGGITPATAVCLRSYSQILGTIVGIGYWIAWTCAASFSAVFFSTTLKQSIFPDASLNVTAVLMILVVTGITLLGLKHLVRIILPLAVVTLIITIVSLILPITSGQINWSQAFDYQWQQPFPGWFGTLTSLVGGMYFVGWIVPAFESTLCFMGEMKDKKKGIKRTLITGIIVTVIYCVIMPIVWLGVLGATPLKNDLITVSDLSRMFIPLGEKPAILFAIIFLLFNTVLSAFTPLCNSPRTLAQLAEDGFIPKIFSKRTVKNQVPWVATLTTAAVAIFIILFGAQTWLIAATNFDYLICISVASIAAYLVSRDSKLAIASQNQGPSHFVVKLGLIAACIWTLASILGFQQYGLPTIVIGIAFAFAGSLFLVVRKITDRLHAHQPWFSPTLQLKFLGTIFMILILDSVGYLIAVQYILQLQEITPLVVLLEDIFVAVALFTISVGLVVPGTIVSAAENISQSAIQLAKGTLLDFSNAMIALGQGQLEKASVNINIVPLPVYTNDEIGKMAQGFNLLQAEIARSAEGLKGARENLIQARQELLEINEGLESRVEERTKELTLANQTLQKTLNNLTLAQDKLIEIGKMTLLEGIIASITNAISEPIGVSVTAISQLKEDISNSIISFNNHKLSESQLKRFFYISDELTKLTENNLKRAVDMFDKFKQVSIDQLSESQTPRNFYLNEYLEFIILSLQPALKKARLTTSLECPENLVIKNYPGVIFQVINILVTNSIMHAFKPDQTGNINICVTTNNSNVILEYSDTGCGIPSENIKKIFEPFFTTKHSKGCLGLGLHIAYSRIVRLLNGSIQCVSKPGQGATFIITFPAKL